MSKKIQDVTKEDHACVNCAFFDEFPIQKKEDNVLGACKANPPFPPSGEASSSNGLGVWPLVLGTWHCGIFTHIDEKEEK